MKTQLCTSVCEALWGMCAGDAMSMPVHWYYNIQDIKTDFSGWITGFKPPKDRHPSSILTLSNTAGSGRVASSTGRRAPVVGNIILHDKLKYWKAPGDSIHYHQGLQAGENTLNVLCAVRVARVLSLGRFVSVSDPATRAAVLSDYVKFLTTPGTHNDTYAESFHRSFFSEWQELHPTSPNKVLEFAEIRYKQIMDTSFSDSQLNAISCLPMAIPFILLSAAASEDEAVSAAVEFVKLTHPFPKLDTLVSVYARVLHAVLNGASVKEQVEWALKSPAVSAWDTCQHFIQQAERFPNSSEEKLKVHQEAVEALGLACYTKGALSSLFYLAYVFHNDIKGGILANTNCGGENCNRGAALGALLGATAGYTGVSVPQDWKDDLRNAKEEIPKILENLPQ
ncbi:coagulation factor VII isoform X3 [Hoplias malabaricus]|uniref:coagulation factor VII isoform X3 n=1 Tax=Hoplias malabaricus TaxID=27720 RepID=UPI003461D952